MPIFPNMQANHHALILSGDFSPTPCLGLSLLASDYVGDRLQIMPSLRSIFCEEQLSITINDQVINKLAEEYLPVSLLEYLAQPLQTAVSSVLQGDYTLPARDRVMGGLRGLRHAVMMRIIGRLACTIAIPQQTCSEVSALADWCIRFATGYAELELASRHGIPSEANNTPMRLLVIAMGKLGGNELNLSSDIDLVFVSPERKLEADSNDNQQHNQHTCHLTKDGNPSAIESINTRVYFNKVGRCIIALLGQITSDGFVFRTDMRLRPYGDSGALVSSMEGLESYYQEQARTWERYAFSRARIITGSAPHRQRLTSMIEGFVYRRHIDFSVIAQLRELIANISLLNQRQQTENNIKTGTGGIREVEFLAQALQLIYGGVFAQLRVSGTVAVLEQAAQQQLLPAEQSNKLAHHYLWLRDLENRLQAMEDEQTQQLPDNQTQLGRIAAGMGYAKVTEFTQQLEHIRKEIHQLFTRFIEQNKETTATAKVRTEPKWQQLSEALFDNKIVALTKVLDSGELCDQVDDQLKDFFTKQIKLSEATQATLKAIMPLLLQSCISTNTPERCLQRVFELLSNITRRPTYLTLLKENPDVIPWLALTFAASNWCARQVTERPMLLGCFIENAQTWQKPDRTTILQQLRLQLFSLPQNDMEAEMDALRHFALAKQMQVALAQLSENMSLMQVSDHLSYTAEACIDSASSIAWRQLVEKHGAPGEDDLSGFVVIAYGKLGGQELSYTSDLDLVFVFDQPDNPDGIQPTNGDKPISSLQFYQRLAQRIIHLLGAPTTAGYAYQIDSRLRPNGAKGLLCPSLDSWVDYYQNHAWTWEMQALVRARAVCGSPRAIRACEQARKRLLASPRDNAKLQKEVIAMRSKMEQTHGNKDTKQMRGGLVDIEFIVQYLALKHAANKPDIIQHSDNKRIIRTLAKYRLITANAAKAVQQTYLALRNINHNNYLEIARDSAELPYLTAVVELWYSLFPEASKTDKSDGQGQVPE